MVDLNKFDSLGNIQKRNNYSFANKSSNRRIRINFRSAFLSYLAFLKNINLVKLKNISLKISVFTNLHFTRNNIYIYLNILVTG